MCGIAGLFRFSNEDSSAPLAEESTKRALEKIKYRGPDVSQIQRIGSCVLGHNRLKIVDLSDAANQPMSDASGRYWIAFNGEIFNVNPLRKKLEDGGVKFTTTSDTEVLLQLLIKDNNEALNQLNGFFAFAFYDKEKNSMLIARDRFGEKPLWYHFNKNEIYFASGLKALRAYPIPLEIDTVSLSLFLQLTYIPAPHSILQNVFKLEPGHCISISNQNVTIEKWYKPEQSIESISIDQPVETFKKLLQEAVSMRLHADVPIGCFLSGGIDSSIVALLASRELQELSTFSVGFSDQPFLDETKFAQEVARSIGSRHEVFEINSAELIHELQLILENMDEPFADSSSIATSLLSSKVKQRVTVALSGDGADEILGGYNKHIALQTASETNLKNLIIPGLQPVIDILPEGRGNAIVNRFRQLKKYSGLLHQNQKSRYVSLASWSDEKLCELMMTQELTVRRGARLNYFVQDISKDFNSVLKADQLLVLSNDMLTKVDSMSMLHALEVRPPFLDFHVVEFINALPSKFKVHKGKRKILLHEAYSKELPKSVFNRPKKGFEVPLENWLRKELKPMVLDMLSKENITSGEFLKRDIIQVVLDEFYNKGKNKHCWLIYSLLVFEIWYRDLKN